MVTDALVQSVSVLLLGLVLGLQHALDADHVAAMSTLISRERSLRRVSWLGTLWGIGHTTTLLTVGLIILLLKVTIPKTLALSFEFLVGGVLVFLGLAALLRARKLRLHLHQHTHAGKTHTHLHAHAQGGPHVHAHSHQSFALGLLHGLAGSAALMLLVLSTVHSVVAGVYFILIFGIGSVLGMLIVSSILGSVFMYTAQRFERFSLAMHVASGAISIILGASIMYQIGIAQGLLAIP